MFDEEFHWLCSRSWGLILQNQSSPKADLRLRLECQTVLPIGYYCRQKWWQSGDEAVWNCFLTRPKYLKRKWKYECIIFWRCLRSSPATYRQLQGFLPAIVSFMSSFQGFLFITVTSLNLTTVPLKVIWPPWSPRCVKWNPEVTSLGSVMWLPWPCTRWLYCFFFHFVLMNVFVFHEGRWDIFHIWVYEYKYLRRKKRAGLSGLIFLCRTLWTLLWCTNLN